METYEQMIAKGWKPQGKRFGHNMEFEVLVLGNMVCVYNAMMDCFVIGPFPVSCTLELAEKKNETEVEPYEKYSETLCEHSV